MQTQCLINGAPCMPRGVTSRTATFRALTVPLLSRPCLPARQQCRMPLTRRVKDRAPVTTASAAASVQANPQGPSAVAAATTDVCLPPAILTRIVGMGVTKAGLSSFKTVLLGLLAGVYVGFGALVMLHIGANCPGLAASNPGLQKLVAGAFGLPFGLFMVLVCGAELFTGNTCIMAAAMYAGAIKPGDLIKNWILSYGANLAGGLFLVWLICYAGVPPPLATTTKIAIAKSSLTFSQAFARGILANWLVNIGVWQATATTSLPGKLLAAVVPVITFVACGLEHSVANMFFIPMGIFLGADISWRTFFLNNLLPVTLGNIIGGAIMVAGAYSLAWGGNKSA
mmetsp:Transcript_6450/g.18608  ORF Transcript_6450/g.18608 Transcript_6450/m.18608 type:complete len:341 (-) Transcript_6450:3-1025(-)